MKLIAPHADVIPGTRWSFSWNDVDDQEGPFMNFWLTHYASPPQMQPIKLNDEPVNAREKHQLNVPGCYDIPCANGWRIWAMQTWKHPQYNKDPIAESEGLNVRCTRKSDVDA